jgi:SAM-dependent methyltransferase
MKQAARPGMIGVMGKYAGFAATTIRRRGLLGSACDLVSEIAFDRRHGLRAVLPAEVAGPESAGSGTAESDAVQYQGVPPRVGMKILSQLPPVALRATFVDFGCGKGRGLALGMLAGFRRLHGVELLPSLAEAARRNLRKLGTRHPESVLQVSSGDAAAFALPAGAVVAFLYNPFRGATLRAVAERLRDHAVAYPVWVIYVNPAELAVFEVQGFSVESDVRRGRDLEAVILVPPPVADWRAWRNG